MSNASADHSGQGQRATAFLESLRTASRASYEETKLPLRTGHAWRYTDPAIFIPKTITPGIVAPEGGRRILPATPTPGISIVRFNEAVGADALAIEEFLGSAVSAADGKLESLDLASWQDAVLVNIAPGASPDEPIHLSTIAGTGLFSCVRLLVVAGEGSMVTLLDDYPAQPIGNADGLGEASPSGSGTESSYILHSTVEIIAGPSSCVRYAAMQELGSKAVFLLKQRARAQAESSILSSIFSFGGSVARADLGTTLEGRGASSQSFGVAVGSGTQHFDHHTAHLHRAPGTRSNFDFRAILSGQARSVYTGSIIIEKDAPGCEAFQLNRNLMLSDTVRADSIPELEIKNDDVRCSHGSATGPVEPSQVFYLMARGLSEPEAVRLVAEGFAEQLFARVPPEIRERAHARLSANLEAL